VSSAFMLGPLGAMVEVPGVQRGAARATTRAGSELVTLGGVRYVQRAGRVQRAWTLQVSPWTTPETVRWLQAAAQGLLGDLWLLDVASARANMLPSWATAGRPGTGGTPLVVGFATGVSLAPLPVGQTVTVPIVASQRWYRLTGRTSATAGDTIMTTSMGGLDVDVVAPAGVGTRDFELVRQAVYAGALPTTYTAEVVSPYVTALRLAMDARYVVIDEPEFADAGGWLPGEDTPCRVVVDDVGRALQSLLTTGHGRSDYDPILLREVGTTGAI
jgi:hypothetical protein